MGTNRFREIYQGDAKRFLTAYSVLERCDRNIVRYGSRCVQKMGTVSDDKIQQIILEYSGRFRPIIEPGHYEPCPHPPSSFSNISIESDTAMVVVSACDAITVTGVSAGNNTILVLRQMSITTIRVLANTYRIQFDPTEDKNEIYKLVRRD
jgi:hypothetical protein